MAGLATATGMSKSGVFGLFGSKEELQRAVIGHARSVFVQQVVQPALTAPPGLPQLRTLCLAYLDHVERRDYPGGCFFASVAAEVGSRPGLVRDLIAAEHDAWIALLTDQARRAADGAELPAGSDPVRLAVELGTMLTGADIAYLLHDDPQIIDIVRSAVNARLVAGKSGKRRRGSV